ncbi:MAG: WG repeat-containing protein, partial [Paludibacteraceae bacterium]|nr:WG repeat-containing protein [Paludibacteraceae bacterium]
VKLFMKKQLLLSTAVVLSIAMLTSCENAVENLEGTPYANTEMRWRAGVDSSNLWGYINEKGEMIIPVRYESAEHFSCGWARVSECNSPNSMPIGKYIDKNGREGNYKITNVDYFDWASYFSYNRVVFFDEGLKGLYDENFNVVFSPTYKTLGYNTKDGLICFSSNGNKRGYIDENGEVVIEEQFDMAFAFVDGMANVFKKVNERYRYGIINKKGKFLFDYQWAEITLLGQERIAFRDSLHGKYGMMNNRGKEIVGAKYTSISPFTNGLACVNRDGKFGYINASGVEVIPCQYYKANSFYDGVADVKKNENSCWELIDVNGQMLYTLEEDERLRDIFLNGLGLVHNVKSNQFRYINKKGETIYKWTPKTTMINFAPISPGLEEENVHRMEQTEYGAIFRNMELIRTINTIE